LSISAVPQAGLPSIEGFKNFNQLILNDPAPSLIPPSIHLYKSFVVPIQQLSVKEG
jgi:hypothetical protein